MKKKILFVFGTRPEAIKLAPLILECRKYKKFIPRVCVTSQHKALLREVLNVFKIKPHYDLNLMRDNQRLDELHARVLLTMENVLEKEKPSLVVVQGDTTSAFCGALSAFYKKIPLAHIEAGLRSFDKYRPFPEEINRKLITALTDYHFCPTEKAKENLKWEGVSKNVFIVGNTVLDALRIVSSRKDLRCGFKKLAKIIGSKKIVLVTLHRRETWGNRLKGICKGLKKLAGEFKDCYFVFPVHPNPRVKNTVTGIFKQTRNVIVCPALNYKDFILLMKSSYLILTDSGGIQEEAPSFRIPVLVLRDVTERPEIVQKGGARIVGTSPEKIVKNTRMLMTNNIAYGMMRIKKNPYGDGFSSKKILKILKKTL